MMNTTILIVEDDQGIRKYLSEILTDERFHVYTAENGTAALAILEKIKPDLVLLDLKLPDISGESICQSIKKYDPEIVVIMLTAKDRVPDIVQGFTMGADDYVKKPFTPEELLARIKARLKSKNPTSVLKVADLVVDTKSFEVKRANKKIALTAQEYKLLTYLMTNKNQLLSREMILSRIWDHSEDVETRVVDVYIGYLRRKIDFPFRKKLIHSVRGFGYILRD